MQSLKSYSTTPTPERSVRHVVPSFSSSSPSDAHRIDLLAVAVRADGLSRRGESRDSTITSTSIVTSTSFTSNLHLHLRTTWSDPTDYPDSSDYLSTLSNQGSLQSWASRNGRRSRRPCQNSASTPPCDAANPSGTENTKLSFHSCARRSTHVYLAVTRAHAAADDTL